MKSVDMSYKILSTVGLLLGIIGGAIIFKWGLPQPDFGEGVTMGLSGPEIDEENRKTAKRRWAHSFRSYCGLSLVMLGFLVQGVATWL